MNFSGSPYRLNLWIRAALTTVGANLVLAAIAATNALARGGSGSHSFSGGSHSSGGGGHHISSGHFIYHNGHYFYSSTSTGSHVAGGVVAAIVFGSFALVAIIPLTIWLVRRGKRAAESAVHVVEARHEGAHLKDPIAADDAAAGDQPAADPDKRQPTGV
jgi:hypothetical protein